MLNAPVLNPNACSNNSVLAFKPRQVLLLSKSPPPPQTTMNNNNGKDKSSLLFHSVAQFLQRRGLKKTLKKFLFETQIKDVESTIDLEEVFSKFLEKRDVPTALNTSTNKKQKQSENIVNHGTDKQQGSVDGKNESTEVAVQDVKSKDKKRNNKKSLAQEEQVNTEILKEHVNDGACDLANEKGKDKKKKKKGKLESDVVEDVSKDPVDTQSKEVEEKAKEPSDGDDANNDDTVKKTKDKKKKKKSSENAEKLSESQQGADTHKSNEENAKVAANDTLEKSVKADGQKKRKNPLSDKDSKNLDEAKQDVGEEENKHSKKRKRLASEEDATEPVDEKDDEESKRRKIDGQANGNIKNDGEKSSGKNTAKKQRNGSVEPKSVNRFQRVKVEEVVFSDERLQDNSYWAKDGADTGYGAKAQEVLGQVKGKGFRHEKTKKKRGTYRGGQIDLQSHSIKFNYSDEE